MAEKAKRDEDNKILDECLKIFDDQVAKLDAGMRGKVTDYSDDKQFNGGTDIGRRTGASAAASAGKVAEQTASAAAGKA